MVEVPEPEPAGLTTGGRAARLLADPPNAAVLFVCAAILGLRRAGAFTNPQFWAEDGYFYERARSVGWHSLWLPYNGYLHLVPRSAAIVAAHADPALVPSIFVGFAALFTLYVASRTLSPRCPLPRYAGLAALAVVLVPDTYEVLLNLVNLQWVLAGGLVLLLVSRDPSGWGPWIHDLAASVALGLTGPFSIVLAPLFLWRAWMRKTRASALLAAAVAACAVVQAYCVSRLLLPAIGRRIGGSLLLGSLVPGEAAIGVGTVAGLATLAAIGFLALRPGPARRERCVLGIALFGILAASLLRTRWTLHEYFTPHSDSRYVFVPQLLALWLLISAACGSGWTARWAAAAALACLAFNLPRLREPAYADMKWTLYVPAIRAGEAVRIPINPEGWILTLPAREK
jgi:hypothetical protein